MVLLIIIFVDLLVIGAMTFTPYVTRKTELFGVSIPSAEANRPECNELRDAYRNRMLLLSVPFLAFTVIPYLLMGPENVTSSIIYTVVIFIYLFLGFGIYLLGHKDAQKLKQNAKWANPVENAALIVDTTPVSGELVSPAWLLTYPVIFVLTLIGIALVWNQAPEMIPMHYDSLGNVTRYAPKSIKALLLIIVFTGVFFITKNAKRQIDAANPELSREQGRRFRRFTSTSLLIGGTAMILFFGVLQILMLLGASSSTVMWLSLGSMLPILLVIPILYLRMGQGGSRLKSAKIDNSNNVSNYDSDSHWKLGVFYYNPEDPAIFIEKRFGIGYTNNWAHPLSWLLIVGLLVLCVGVTVISILAE